MGAAWMLAMTPGLAQETGVARPSEVITTDGGDVAPTTPRAKSATTPAAKPSAAIPAASSETVYGAYVPYKAPGAVTTVQTTKAFDPDANMVTQATAGRDERRLLNGTATKADPDAGLVTTVPANAGEIPDGTLVRVRLREDLSTLKTVAGTKFSAAVSEAVMRDGRVIVPVGSILEGRVTYVRGGRRIGGGGAIHLEPRTVTLPDGAQYLVHARVIDTNNWNHTKVDREGTIMRSDSRGKTIAAFGLAAGGPMAAGAVIGGVPGAVIGAGVGAGVGTVIWLKQDRQAELPKDLVVVFSLTEPMSVTPMSASIASIRGSSTGD